MSQSQEISKAPRRQVVERHKFLNLSWAAYDVKLSCGHFVPGTERQAFSKTMRCNKCPVRA